jgi:hypothetical protein
MAKKKERGNGSGTVYPRKNKQGRKGAHPRTVGKLAEALGVAPSELIRGGGGRDG